MVSLSNGIRSIIRRIADAFRLWPDTLKIIASTVFVALAMVSLLALYATPGGDKQRSESTTTDPSGSVNGQQEAAKPGEKTNGQTSQPTGQTTSSAESTGSTSAPTQGTPQTNTSGYPALTPGTSWQWQLTGTINTTILDGVSNSKKMYDIDLFDAPTNTIKTLKNKGITVVCYFSAGSAENWRPDYSSFPASVKGNPLEGWAGETWLDIRVIDTLRSIMTARMDLAVQKGCDGVEPDNVDAYTNNSGFPLTSSQQLTYNKMLATEAHARNLSVGLKNDVDQIDSLVDSFDWALNEQCYQYDECGNYNKFIKQNKAVFGVEYELATSAFCTQANSANYDWLKKDYDLGATPRTACRNG